MTRYETGAIMGVSSKEGTVTLSGVVSKQLSDSQTSADSNNKKTSTTGEEGKRAQYIEDDDVDIKVCCYMLLYQIA